MTALDELREETEKLRKATAERRIRMDKEERRFNFLFVVIFVILIVLLFARLGYPDGIPWVVDHAPGAVVVEELK